MDNVILLNLTLLLLLTRFMDGYISRYIFTISKEGSKK